MEQQRVTQMMARILFILIRILPALMALAVLSGCVDYGHVPLN